LSFTLKVLLLDCRGTELKLSKEFSTSSGRWTPSSRTIEGMGVYATDVETDVEEKELERGRRNKYVRGVINGNI